VQNTQSAQAKFRHSLGLSSNAPWSAFACLIPLVHVRVAPLSPRARVLGRSSEQGLAWAASSPALTGAPLPTTHIRRLGRHTWSPEMRCVCLQPAPVQCAELICPVRRLFPPVPRAGKKHTCRGATFQGLNAAYGMASSRPRLRVSRCSEALRTFFGLSLFLVLRRVWIPEHGHFMCHECHVVHQASHIAAQEVRLRA
jgi:hypothetical protein